MKMIITYIIMLMLAVELSSAITINEIMYNPTGDDNNKEFIEIFMDTPENLTAWIIADSASNDSLNLLYYSGSGYAIIVEDGFDFTGINASVYSAGATIGNNLDNTADSILLYTPDFTMVASAQYNGTIANGNGKSMELIGGAWLESAETGGTPGRQNTAAQSIANESNGTQGNQTMCNVSFSVATDKNLYNNSEKVEIGFSIDPEPDDFAIEYWIEDLAGNIAKAKYNTTNTGQKSWTPSIDEEDKSFFVKANLYMNCSREEIMQYSEKLITVKGSPKPSQSSISIKEVYIGEDESIEFGKPLRVRLDIYKGDEASSTVEAWIEDLDSSDKISEISKLTLYDKFREYDLTLPVQIKNNCNRKYSDGSYTLIAEGFNMTQKREVRVEGIVSSMCPETAETSETENQKISYDIIASNESIISGEAFTTEISISNDGEQHEFALWSYVYRGSKSYSGEREGNEVTIDLGPYEARTVELNNTVEDAEPGDYKLKVKIQKDGQKTTSDITRDVVVSAPAIQEDNGIDPGVIALVSLNSSNNSSGSSTNPSGKDGKEVAGNIVYVSASRKSKGMAPYFIIASIAIITTILIIKYKWRNTKGKTTQKL